MHRFSPLSVAVILSLTLLPIFSVQQEVPSGGDPTGREGSGSVAPQTVPGEGKGTQHPPASTPPGVSGRARRGGRGGGQAAGAMTSSGAPSAVPSSRPSLQSFPSHFSQLLRNGHIRQMYKGD